MKDKKIGLIIAFKDFRDEEYFITKDVFEEKGIKTETISKDKGKALSYFGGQAEVDSTLEEIDPKNFDALVFVGGKGAKKLIGDKRYNKIIKEAKEKNKILAAICIAPLILAETGVLEDKKATVWSSEENKEPIDKLEEKGASYKDKPVVKDGKLITAWGPKAARSFARKVASLLKKNN